MQGGAARDARCAAQAFTPRGRKRGARLTPLRVRACASGPDFSVLDGVCLLLYANKLDLDQDSPLDVNEVRTCTSVTQPRGVLPGVRAVYRVDALLSLALACAATVVVRRSAII